MKKSDLTYFRTLLQNWRDQLLNQADDTVSNLLNSSRMEESDPLDRASIETEQNFLLRIRGRESRLLNKIKEALKRIEDGEFGICDRCGEDIALQRLKARPVTTFCIECKKASEAAEKVHSG